MLAGSLGGCAGAAAELALPALPSGNGGVRESGGEAVERGATFAGLQLRTRRDAVFADLAGGPHLAGEVRCAFTRLAPVDGSRRAFPLERCEHAVTGSEAEGPRLADRRVRHLVTYFVDERLVRVDALVASDETDERTRAAMRARLDERFGTRVQADGGLDRWELGDDLVELGGMPADAVRLSLVDGEALVMLPALAAEDPMTASD